MDTLLYTTQNYGFLIESIINPCHNLIIVGKCNWHIRIQRRISPGVMVRSFMFHGTIRTQIVRAVPCLVVVLVSTRHKRHTTVSLFHSYTASSEQTDAFNWGMFRKTTA